MDDDLYWLILLILDFILYGGCCFMILKRKNFTVISIRSPKLLLLTILGNFFMSLVLIIDLLFGQSFFSSFFYFFRILMIVSMLLRYERIIFVCGIKRNDAVDRQLFFTKRHLYLEKFYMRILIIVSSIFLLITIIVAIIKLELFRAFFINDDEIKGKMYISVIWYFIELIALITYLFRTFQIISPKQFVKFELYTFLIIWVIYNNLILILRFSTDESKKINQALIIISKFFFYIILFLNGYLPIILSFISRSFVQYHFTFKTMNNLYLFLTDETCYECFNNYLLSRPDNGSYLLKLYTHIMKYKLDFFFNYSNEQRFNAAVVINNTFFENENEDKIDIDVFNRVRSECKALLDNHRYDKNQFDVALKYCYDELNIKFNDFKTSRQFNELYASILLTSYVKCKMCNIGMINKY